MTSSKIFTSPFYPPNPFAPHGLDYQEWGKRWYEWIQSIARAINPARDVSGENCNLNQNGLVWFLAGSTGGRAVRTCDIPRGKDIFLSIINEMASTAQYGKRGNDLMQHCNNLIGQVNHKEVIFDSFILQGSELEPYRVQTNIFSTNLRLDNLCGVPSGLTEVVCDGYWVMIKKESLTLGKHILHSHGAQNDGFESEVTYYLAVR